MTEQPKPALTMEYIRSPACHWPPTVKARAEEIIRLNAELVVQKHRTIEHNMMASDKIQEIANLAECYRKMARAYTNLHKELVYYLSRPSQITEGN